MIVRSALPLSFAVYLLLIALSAHAQPLSKNMSAQIDSIFAPYNRSNGPGCAVGIYHNGKLVYAKGYGVADLEHGVKITPHTMFDIGSTSKQFTATCLVLLAQQGKLSLDDDIRTYLPEIPDYGHTITIRNMLNHTSGLRDYIGLLVMSGADIDDVTNTDQTLQLLSRQKGLDFTPGTEHAYSNTGYFLASVIVRRVSGQTLREFARDHIFTPLGMTRTGYIDDHTAVVPDRAIGYSGDSVNGYHRNVSNWEQNGDGGVMTNVEELARWDENFYHPVIGGSTLKQELLRRGVLTNGDTLDYALGLIVDSLRGVPIVSHGGAWGGYRAELLRVPSEHISVAVLSNLGSINASRLARRAAIIMLGDRVTAEPPPPAAPTIKHKEVAINPAIFDAYTGEYALDEAPEFTMTFRRDSNRFYIQPTGQSEDQLFASSDSTFFVKTIDASFTFHRVADSAPTVTLHQGGAYNAHRTVPFIVPAAKLSEYIGTYFSSELNIEVRLAVVDGKLKATRNGLDSADLKAYKDDSFRGGADYVNDVSFERDANNKVAAMLVSFARNSAIRFERR